jgi:hypothetical protein
MMMLMKEKKRYTKGLPPTVLRSWRVRMQRMSCACMLLSLCEVCVQLAWLTMRVCCCVRGCRHQFHQFACR